MQGGQGEGQLWRVGELEGLGVVEGVGVVKGVGTQGSRNVISQVLSAAKQFVSIGFSIIACIQSASRATMDACIHTAKLNASIGCRHIC